jgi:hypothetical protein
MNRFLISYDLRQPHKDYTSLHRHLENDYSSSKRPLASLWILKSTLDHTGVRDSIKRFIDQDDKLLVVDITGDASAWFNIDRDQLNL